MSEHPRYREVDSPSPMSSEKSTVGPQDEVSLDTVRVFRGLSIEAPRKASPEQIANRKIRALPRRRSRGASTRSPEPPGQEGRTQIPNDNAGDHQHSRDSSQVDLSTPSPAGKVFLSQTAPENDPNHRTRSPSLLLTPPKETERQYSGDFFKFRGDGGSAISSDMPTFTFCQLYNATPAVTPEQSPRFAPRLLAPDGDRLGEAPLSELEMPALKIPLPQSLNTLPPDGQRSAEKVGDCSVAHNGINLSDI